MIRQARGVAFGLLLTGWMNPANALDPTFRHRIYGLDDGLPSTEIRDIRQDAEGRLWLATRSGLINYDGSSWSTIGVGEGLSWADQAGLRFDGEGRLYSVSTQPPFRISRVQDGKPELLGVGEASDAEVDLQKLEVLIGTTRPFLAVLRSDGRIAFWRESRWLKGTAEGVSDIAVADGRLLAATTTGLLRLDPTSLNFDQLPAAFPSPPQALSIEAGRVDDTAWLVGRDWIARATLSRAAATSNAITKLEILGRDLDLPRKERLFARADGRGGLFVAGSDFLGRFHPKTGWQTIDLDVNGLAAVFVDREGILWLAARSGLIKVPSTRFANAGLKQGLADDFVSAWLERPDGSIVLAHRQALTFLEDGKVEVLALPLEPEQRLRDLAHDRQGRIWVAAQRSGLLRIDGGKITTFGKEQGLDGAVSALTIDSQGLLWLGTDQGLYSFSGERFERHGAALQIRRLTFDSQGRLLLATASGLWRFDGRSLHAFTCGDSACRNVFAMLDDPEAGLLVGTAEGLFRMNEAGALERDPRATPRQPIFSISREPGRDSLWLGTNDGVYRIEGRNVSHFSVENGLAGREVSRATGRFDRLGRLWIGTDRGLSIFDPRQDKSTVAPPLVQLLGVEVKGRILPLDQAVHLPAVDNDLFIRFRVLSLLDEKRGQLRFRLVGSDENWTTLDRSEMREARYFGLPHGTYHFEIQAGTVDEVWSGVLHSAEIVIARPFFKKPLFLIAALVGLIGLALAVSSYFTQRRYSKLLETEVAARIAELQASEDRYRKTFRGIDDAVVATDRECRVVLLNPRAQVLTGWTEEEATGRSVAEILRLFQEKGGKSERRGTPMPFDTRELRDSIGPAQAAWLEPRAGERRLVEVSTSSVHGKSGFSGFVFALRDITSKRRLEEDSARVQKLEAVGLLAGGIAHDFNNLLTVLLGNLSLLRDSLALDSESSLVLGDAESALVRARDLTQQLLTFARGGAPVRKTTSIAEIVSDSVSFVLRGSKVRPILELEPDLRPVAIDTGQINQVLSNLLLNALQAMPTGGQIRIVGRNVDDPPAPLKRAPHIVIEVIDQGIGIGDEILPRIFDPYFTTKEEGRGLGLASAHSIVRKHDGWLAVRSQLGQGTTFSIFLPAAGSPQVMVSTPPLSRTNADTGHGLVLLMDDDESVRRTTATMLQHLGYQPVVASDGREAIDLYSEALAQGRKFRAVLMDLTVPGGMGGQQAIKRLVALDPKIVAIVYSGYSNDPVLANFRDYGFSGCLAKPFRVNDLRKVLEEALGEEPGQP